MQPKEVLRLKYTPMRLSPQFRDFFGMLPLDCQTSILLHGNPGGGKSSFALVLAQDLARSCKVHYANLEEKAGPTLITKLKTLKIKSNNIEMLDGKEDETPLEELKRRVASGNYKWCVIDSVSEFAETKPQIEEMYKWIRDNPDISFVLISHSTKGGDYRGASTLKHNCDVCVKVVSGVAMIDDKNRFLRQLHKKKPMFYIFENKVKWE